MQPGAVLFPDLLNRQSFVTELGELDKFFLNLLQSFLPVAVSDVGFCSLRAPKPILFIQLLNVSDFRPKARNLFPKNFKMIHSDQDNASLSWKGWRASDCRHAGGDCRGPVCLVVRNSGEYP